MAEISVSRRAFFGGAVAATALAARPSWGRALVPPARPKFAPRPSDVCFSARFMRPGALDTARAFGANRLDWCYTEDKAFIAQARAAGLKTVGGTLNTTLPDTLGGKTRQQGRIVDINGKPVTAPWMSGWQGIYWGCVNSPVYRQIWLDNARASLAAGVDYFMVDDATMNATAVTWGACYCQYCQAAAAAAGMDLKRDMLALQKQSVTRFHRDMRAGVDRIAGRHITFASNNFRARSGWPYDLFDFGMAEVDATDCVPASIASTLRSAELAGHPQVLTLRSEDVSLNRRMIGWSYANGGHLLAPWDVFLGARPAGKDRFNGTPQDYAPLYNFARSMAGLLDKAIVNAPLAPDAWAMATPGWQASLRTTADGRRAALHLVPWKGEAASRLTIAPRLLLPNAKSARLLAPGGVARPLSYRGGPSLALDVPASPWLVVELATA